MQHITGICRNQMTFSSLEDTISLDNPIRFIDAFVENIALETLAFCREKPTILTQVATIKVQKNQVFLKP